jgi:hypothetical protein
MALLFTICMDKQKETLLQVSETTLDKPDTIEVDVNPVSRFHALMQRWGIAKKKRVFVLKPIYLGTLIRISKLILSVDLHIPHNGEGQTTREMLEANYHSIIKHGETLAEIVALAIQNSKEEAKPELVQFILHNFTSSELVNVLILVLKRMNLSNFMTSIISVRGMNVLGSQTVVPAIAVNGAEVSQ